MNICVLCVPLKFIALINSNSVIGQNYYHYLESEQIESEPKALKESSIDFSLSG